MSEESMARHLEDVEVIVHDVLQWIIQVIEEENTCPQSVDIRDEKNEFHCG